MPTIADYPEKANRRVVNVPTSGIVTLEPSDPYWQDTSEPPYVPAASGRLPTVRDGDGDTLVFEDAWIELIVYTDDSEEFLGEGHPFARPTWLTNGILQAINSSGGTDALLQPTLDTNEFHDDLKLYVIKVVVNDGINASIEGFFHLYPVGQGLGVELVLVSETHNKVFYQQYLGDPTEMFDGGTDVDNGQGVISNGLLYLIREQGGNAKIMTIPANLAGAPYLDGDFIEVYDFGVPLATAVSTCLDVNFGKIAFVINRGTGNERWGIMNIDGSGVVLNTGSSAGWGLKLINASEAVYGFSATGKRRNLATDTETFTKALSVNHYGTAIDIDGDRIFVANRSTGEINSYSLDWSTGPTLVFDFQADALTDSSNEAWPRHYQADTDTLYFIGYDATSKISLFAYNIGGASLEKVIVFPDEAPGLPFTEGEEVSVQIVAG